MEATKGELIAMKHLRRSLINRRRLVASSAVGGAAIMASGQYLRASPGTRQPITLLAQADSADVPMSGGNPARTGEMPGPGPDDANGVEAIWRFPTGDAIVSSPAVVDGMVYVGSDDGNLYALHAENGTERWWFPTGSGIYSSPAVVDGVVYVGSFDDNVYAVDAESGTERWRFPTGSGVSSDPALVDGVVYVGSQDANLYALNAKDGTERWRFATSEWIDSSPAVVDGIVYVGGGDGNLYAVHAGDGTERWRFPAGASITSAPAVVDGVVYVGDRTLEEDSKRYAVDALSGTERWGFSTGSDSSSSPAVVDGVVYLGSGDGNLYAIGARVPRLSVGGTARVTKTTSLRGGPSSTAVERGKLEPDTVVTITDESETTGDVVWWPVVVDKADTPGWVEASNLEPLTSGPNPIGTP